MRGVAVCLVLLDRDSVSPPPLSTIRSFIDPSLTCIIYPLKGSNDGLKVDEEGFIWAVASGGVVILSPEGKQLGM